MTAYPQPAAGADGASALSVMDRPANQGDIRCSNSEVGVLCDLRKAAVAMVVLFPLVLAAQETEGEAELGYLASSGNSETTSLNAKAKTAFDFADWRHKASASAISASDSDETTQERYTAGFQSEYKFSEHHYLFANVNWEKDRFSGIEYRYSETAGYGRRLVRTDPIKLDAEIGAGARQAKLQSDTTSEAEYQRDAIVRGTVQFLWQINEGSRIEQGVVVESGEENTYAESVSSLRVDLQADLFIKASYTIKHNSEVAEDRDETDRYTAVTLGYAW